MEIQRLMYSSDIKKTVLLSTTSSISPRWTNVRSFQNQHKPLVSMAPNKMGENSQSSQGMLEQGSSSSFAPTKLCWLNNVGSALPSQISSGGKPLFPDRYDQIELIAKGLKAAE